MFNIKNIVNKITERGRDSHPNSPGGGEDPSENQQAAEGFLCPKCMTAYPSPEDLQTHYEVEHSSEEEGTEAAVAGFSMLHQEAGLHLQRQAQGPHVSTEKLAAEIQGITSVPELQKSLMDALETKAQLQLEKESLEQRTAQLARVNAALKSVNDEEQGKAALLKDRLKILEDQLSHRESIDDAAVLRQELVQVQRVMDETTRERERECAELRSELLSVKNSYDLLKSNPNNPEKVKELLQMMKDGEANNQRVMKQSKKMSSLYSLETQKVSLLQDDNTSLKKANVELEASLEVANKHLQQAQEQGQSLSENDTKLRKEVAELKRTLEEKQGEVENLTRELRASQGQVEGLVSKVEKLSLAESHAANLMKEKDERLEKLSVDMKRFASDGTQAAEDAVRQLDLEHGARLRELNESISMLKAERALGDEEAEKMKKNLLEKDTLISELQKKNESSIELIMALENDVDKKNYEINHLQGALKEEVAKSETLSESLDAERATSKDAHEKLNSALQQCEELERQKTQLDVNIAALETTIFEKEVQHSKQEEYTQELRDEMMNLCASYELRGVYLNDTREELEKERQQTQVNVDEMRAAYLDRDEAQERNRIGDALIDEQNKALNIKDRKIEELNVALREQADTHAAEIKALKEKLEIQDDLIKSCKEEASDSEREFNSKLDAVQNELAILKKKSESDQRELQGVVDSKNEELKGIQAALDDLAGERLVLEAHLQTSQTEQKTLMEKYYASNSENEAQRRSLDEFRRRCDDSQSGLHELGRENQILRMELEKLLGRKWTEDSDVASCHLCHKEFTLIVRKHHCRNCGQIFCNECSSKSAAVANNKKPVRVCDGCYNELAAAM